MARLRALIFDVDGTLAETERLGHLPAYNAAFAELGLPWRWDDETYGVLLGTAGGKERLRAYIAATQQGDAERDLDALTANIHAAKGRHFAAVARGLALRPGILRLVREARAAGIAVALATTASHASVDALLAGHAELAAGIDVVAAGDVVAQKKPDPAVYRWTLQRLAVAPNAALAIEDSALGLRSARAAGIHALVTPSDYTRGDAFDGAAAVLSDLGEPTARCAVLSGPRPPLGYVDLGYAANLLAGHEPPDGLPSAAAEDAPGY